MLYSIEETDTFDQKFDFQVLLGAQLFFQIYQNQSLTLKFWKKSNLSYGQIKGGWGDEKQKTKLTKKNKKLLSFTFIEPLGQSYNS